MTTRSESGTHLRTTPPAAIPVESINTAVTVPVPRDKVAEWQTLYAAREEHLRRYDEAGDGLSRLEKTMGREELIAVDRWLAQRGD